MFYSQFILAKKGPLGTIWIAAHLERKLRKNQITETDICLSVDSILFPEMPIALRLSSHLLLGVVRIYSKKVNYLFDDCSEVLLKVKQAFRSTAVDLPPEKSSAPYHSITMPETFDLDDFELPYNDLQGNYVDQHISSKEQITLQDTIEGVVYSTSKFGLDERFGDDDAFGLDLDEELDECDGDNELVDYAEAPSTPGPWEEPNLPNILETSACDDHQEAKGNLRNASHQHHHDQLESHEKSPPPHFSATEQTLINDLGDQGNVSLEPRDSTVPVQFSHASLANSDLSVLKPCVAFQNNETNSEEPHATEPLSNKFREVQHTEIGQNHEVRADNVIHREVQGEKINGFTNDFSAPVIQTEIQVNNISSHTNGCFDPVIQMEVQVEKMNSRTNDFFAPVIQRDVQAEHIDSYTNDSSAPVIQMEVQGEKMNSCTNDFFAPVIQREVQVENINSYTNDCPAPVIQRDDQVENINSYTNGSPAPVIQRDDQVENINSYTNDCPVPVIQRDVQVENINSYTYGSPAPVIQREFQVGSNNSYTNCSPALVIQTEVQENINSDTNDYSAPEKRLSLPHWLSDVPNTFVPETTPIEKDKTPGKKRAFIETSKTTHSLNLNECSDLHTTNPASRSFNLNQSSGLLATDTTAQSLNLNESSGFFTSPTPQSLNLNQSSGAFTVNTPGQSVTNNDELLSSILVGRKSSILKLKSTPLTVTPSTKRMRSASASKTGAIKMKALMDNHMVLHGDIIRQQLTNTEDVLRLRKKAPCTRSEISMLKKQFREDRLFREPIFSGVSMKLASLHNQLYNLSKIVVSRDDASLEDGNDPKPVSKNVEQDREQEVGSNVPNPVEQPTESIMVRDKHTHDNNTANLDYYESQLPEIVAIERVAEPINSEHDDLRERNAMEIDPKSCQDADLGVSVTTAEVEPLSHADVVVPLDTFDMSAATAEVQMDASLQTDASGVISSEKVDLLSFDSDINKDKSVENAIASEIQIGVASVREISQEKQDQETAFREISNVESNTQNSVYNGGEEFGMLGTHHSEINPVLENVSFDEKESPGSRDKMFETTAMNESTHPAVENNTDFLNFDDDDDGADAGGEYVDATRVIDNSGWSTRTKAVTKYLQSMFDKEAKLGKNVLAVNNLLAGKTRKEASRMFFETLVLKTKDYIHVEQANPFGNIDIFPGVKLLKSDFDKIY